MAKIELTSSEAYVVAALLRENAEADLLRARALDPDNLRDVEYTKYYPNVEMARSFDAQAYTTLRLANRLEDEL